MRNWDYRYCWLRDAAMTARVLVDLGSLAEAEALLRWVDGCIERTGGHPERLHPLYTVEGLELGAEAVIDTLPGYAGSRPVRVGNAANRQLQLDVFGPIADLVAAVVGRARLGARRATSASSRRWCRRSPAAGTSPTTASGRPGCRRGTTSTPRSCAGSPSTARSQVQTLRGEPDRPDWVELRDRIRANVLEHGWNEAAGAYTVAYGDEEMDASSLWIGLSGLLADDDPRFLATVLKIEAELRSGAGRLPVPLGRRPAGRGGRVPHLHRVADRGVPAHRPARRRRGAVRADARDGRSDRAAARAVRPARRARAGQPPAGLQPPRADPLRGRALGCGRRLLAF